MDVADCERCGIYFKLEALRSRDARRQALQAELGQLDGLSRISTVDEAAVTQAALAKLGDWTALMGRQVSQARQLLRHLLVGRVTFTPREDGAVAFRGEASIGPLLAGTVLADAASRSKALVSPTGFATCCRV